MGFFVGQETVAKDDRVVWSMSYSGGAQTDVADRETLRAIYGFLRKALLAVSVEMPYRGPRAFTSGDMSYRNDVTGGIDRFHGVESISRHGAALYELRYGGGLVR